MQRAYAIISVIVHELLYVVIVTNAHRIYAQNSFESALIFTPAASYPPMASSGEQRGSVHSQDPTPPPNSKR